jgi:endogenous inhibitor of DNA gyrase (YacG/DUF329 family)
MNCPICKRPVKKSDEDFPFCSDRCRTIDLGNWASERYVISEPADPRDLILAEDDEAS